MKISKLFHFLYAILIFVPFVAVVFNFVRFGLSSSIEFIDFSYLINSVSFPVFGGVSETIFNVFFYLIADVFGLSGDISVFIANCMNYWLCLSVIWLCFDVVMYIPLLVHRWLDKGVIQ